MTAQSLAELPRPLALVLGGGGSLGALQVGMLQVLDAAGVRPDLVVGTSVGALNGAVVAERGLSAAISHLDRVWRSTRRRDVMPVRVSALRSLVRRSPVFDSSGIERLVHDNLAARSFGQLDRRLVVVATDAHTGEPFAFERGDIVTAIAASAAIPGVFAPVEVDGRFYVDGGVSANLAIGEAHQRGAASIIALDIVAAPAVSPTPRREPPTTILDAARFAGGVIFRQQRQAALQAAAVRVPVIVLEAPETTVHPLKFSDASELIEAGRRQAQAIVNVLSVDGPGVYGLAR